MGSEGARLRVYLDLCCLKRPLDDQLQERVRIEAEAVKLILERIDRGVAQGCNSEALSVENAENPVPERRARASELLHRMGAPIRITRAVQDEATRLVEIGFHAFDALHMASAAAGGADVMLTCDDRLLARARRRAATLPLRVMNPVDYVRDVRAGAP